MVQSSRALVVPGTSGIEKCSIWRTLNCISPCLIQKNEVWIRNIQSAQNVFHDIFFLDGFTVDTGKRFDMPNYRVYSGNYASLIRIII